MTTGIYLIDHPPATRQYRSPRRAQPSGVCVVHTAESFPDETGPDTGAESVAAFIARRTNPGSYHDLADSDSSIQLVRYEDEAFHDATGSNPHSYGVSAATQAAKWSALSPEWTRQTVHRMAFCASRYSFWIHGKYGIIIPARRVNRVESENRRPGFISHAERDPERRTDPGRDFPWAYFLAQYSALRFPALPPPIRKDKDMQLFKLGRTRYRAAYGDQYHGVPSALGELWESQGVVALGITDEYDAYLAGHLVAENVAQFDPPDPS